ncbi:MAG: GTPase HflX [Oscillospiraceae bacterium]|jgi:GTP-binding protein HflX|nr:GTPase HflX [Oscillospiraceae bacterium]
MPTVHGNTTGIRQTHIERLESVYDMEIDRKQFCTAELLESLASFTGATGREAMAYIDRSGRVAAVAVGEQDRATLPALRKRRSESRLSGLRCIHTHPGGDPSLSTVDIQALKSLRLDAMAAVGVVEGKPSAIQIGILGKAAADGDFSVIGFGPYDIHAVPDRALWAEIRSADARIRPDVSKKAEAEIARAILVGIDGKQEDHDPLKELSQLADTAGFITVGSVTQPRSKPDNGYYLGYGKLQDLVLTIQALRADVVIFDDELSPAQIRNIQKELGKTEIMDRTSLILDIFSNRASTHEGRLQVELAQTKYLLPRMTGYWTHMSRMGGGGSGGGGARRGEGETQLEVDRRLLRKRLHELEKEIDKVKSRRGVQRMARERSHIPVAAFVGYTNAGKSTLMNCLSGSDVLAEDKLFATLDPISRRVNLGSGEVLLVDTVGFINKLPHDLVDAFRATLEETRTADLLLHVVDASSGNRALQMEVVREVLDQLGAGNKPVLTVYNKCDILSDTILEKDGVAVSALTGMGIDALKKAVARELSAMRTELSVLLPLDSGAIVSRLYASGHVSSCVYTESGIQISAAVSLEDASRLRASAIKVY